MIRVLLVDDSPSFRAALSAVLSEDARFCVVGEAGSGEEGVRLARQLRPDLLVMDVRMPGMGGMDATAAVMRETPCPVVILSALVDTQSQSLLLEARRAGAVEVLAKPNDLSEARTRVNLRETLRSMSEVKVIRQRALPPAAGAPGFGLPPPGLVVIGASTGGPAALLQVLKPLSEGFPWPIVVAQHLAPGFARGLWKWLSGSVQLPCELVEQSAQLRPGRVYFPSDGRHIEVTESGVLASLADLDGRAVPSVTKLFDSTLPRASQVVAVLLTGMGVDGAAALRRLRDRGAQTIIQDEWSSIVHGMAGAARDLGAASEELPLSSIGQRIADLAARAQGTR